jgi:hypothetical protein
MKYARAIRPGTLRIFGVVIMLLTGFTLFTSGATAAVHVPDKGKPCKQPAEQLLDGTTGNVTGTGDYMWGGPDFSCHHRGLPQPSDTLTYYCYVAVQGDQFNTWTYASYTDTMGNDHEGWLPDDELTGDGSGVECPGQ